MGALEPVDEEGKIKFLKRRKENPLEVIEKTQLGCVWVAIVSNNRVSIKTGGFFDQKVFFFY